MENPPFDRPMTALEILTRQDGDWKDVIPSWRLVTAIESEDMPPDALVRFARDTAQRAFSQQSRDGQRPTDRALSACFGPEKPSRMPAADLAMSVSSLCIRAASARACQESDYAAALVEAACATYGGDDQYFREADANVKRLYAARKGPVWETKAADFERNGQIGHLIFLLRHVRR